MPRLPPPLLTLLLVAYGKYLKIKNQNADTLGQLTLVEEESGGERVCVCVCVCCMCVLAFPRVLKLPSIYSWLLL